MAVVLLLGELLQRGQAVVAGLINNVDLPWQGGRVTGSYRLREGVLGAPRLRADDDVDGPVRENGSG